MLRTAQANWLFERLPPWVTDTLTTEQREAIHEAVSGPEWDRHQVNIRLTIPFFGRYYYLTVVCGEGRRSIERRDRERHRYPLRTAANIFFFVAAAALFYAAALVAVAVLDAFGRL